MNGDIPAHMCLPSMRTEPEYRLGKSPLSNRFNSVIHGYLLWANEERLQESSVRFDWKPAPLFFLEAIVLNLFAAFGEDFFV